MVNGATKSSWVIVFDDSGCNNHTDTKYAIDKFFKDKPGILMQLPTAQVIFFKN